MPPMVPMQQRKTALTRAIAGAPARKNIARFRQLLSVLVFVPEQGRATLHLSYPHARGMVSEDRPELPEIRSALRFLGHNLVRLVYLDEGGIDYNAPVLSVAGVMVHGDLEYPEIDKQILGIVDRYIPKSDRL